MTYHFSPAVREQVSVLIALAGASGSGKTMSALRLAKGMAPAGKIAFIDTEARRGLHYADQFDFMHCDMHPPFHPDRFVDAVHAAEEAGAEVIIIDSFSHEHDGPGGIVEMAQQIEEGGVKGPGAWKIPKARHKRMVQTFLQSRANLIFCLRADEKIKMEKQNGRTVVIPLGWTPICEKRFMYEMTASFTLVPDDPGRPHFELPHKLQEQHRAMFPAGELISEQSGSLLAAWARGGTAPAKGSVPPAAARASAAHPPGSAADVNPMLVEMAREAAMRGREVFDVYYRARSAAEKAVLREMKPELMALMEETNVGEITGKERRTEHDEPDADDADADAGDATAPITIVK